MVLSNELLAEIPWDGTEEKDILTELQPEDVDRFCDTLKADWPLSIHAYNFIKTMSEWKIKKPSLKCQLLCVDADDSLATFVGILESEKSTFLIIVYTLEESTHQLEEVLSRTSKIRWEIDPIFEAVLEKHSGAVKRAITRRGKTPELYCNSTLYHMNQQRAADIDLKIPHDVTIGDLSPADIDYMYSEWAHNDIYSKQELRDAVNFNRGVGVYSRCDGRLLAWAVHTHYGGIGNLQTRKGEQGKGYGKLITQYLSRELSRAGYHVHCMIKKENEVSQYLFTGAGFEFKSPLSFLVAT